MFDFPKKPSHCPLCQTRLPPEGFSTRETWLLNQFLTASERRAAFWWAAGREALAESGDEKKATETLATQLWLDLETARRSLPLRPFWRNLLREALSRVDWPEAAAAWIGEGLCDEDSP